MNVSSAAQSRLPEIFKHELKKFWVLFEESHSGFKSVSASALAEALEALRSQSSATRDESESTYGCVKEEQGSAVQFAEVIVETIRKYEQERKSSRASVAINATVFAQPGRFEIWKTHLCLIYEHHRINHLVRIHRNLEAVAAAAEELLLLINRPSSDENSSMPTYIYFSWFFCFCNLVLFLESFLYLLLYHIEGKES